jgi:hypothetical protein
MSRPPRKIPKKKAAPPVKVRATPTAKRPPDYSAISSRSTTASNQRTRAIALLNIADQTTYNFRAHGIAQCATRIWELKKLGWPITKTTVTAVDSDGYMHVGVALYSLKEVTA